MTRRTVAPMPEDEMQENIRQLCAWLKLPYYHPWNSLHSPEGFPDCVIVRGEHLLFRECKSARGVVSPAQQDWLGALARVRVVSAGVWRPAHWQDGRIEAELNGKQVR